MSVQYDALRKMDILEEIVDRFSSEEREHVASLARVSRAFHVPATKALWAELPSLRPLLSLLPEFERLYRAHRQENPEGRNIGGIRLSEPVSSETRALFRDRAALVRVLHSYDKNWEGENLASESWSYLVRLFADTGSPFVALRTITSLYPTATGDDLRFLASPSLQSLDFRYAWTSNDGHGDRCALAMRNMLANAPALTELNLTSSNGDFFEQITPADLAHLKTLRFVVEDAWPPLTWYPTAASLRMLSTLPALEHLQVELCATSDYKTDFTGFPSLSKLHLIGCSSRQAIWFLAGCASPGLAELTLSLSMRTSDFDWADLHPFCSTIARRAPALRRLVVTLNHFHHTPERSPDMLLGAVRPLLALHGLTELSLWFDHVDVVLSDAALGSFAEAWPELVSLKICFRLQHSDMGASRPFPTTVSLRALRAFSIHCPKLQVLHIPHLHVPLEDCDDGGTGRIRVERPHTAHKLSQLTVCSAVIVDAPQCAAALHRIFRHLDVDGSRKLFVESHTGRRQDLETLEEDRLSTAAWLNMLNALECCQMTAGAETGLSLPDSSST